jgi:hypothetical protein
MAFYYVFDGVVDVAVSFDDDEWLGGWFSTLASGDIVHGAAGSLPNIAAGVVSLQLYGQQYVETYEANYAQSLSGYQANDPYWSTDEVIDAIANGVTFGYSYSLLDGTASGSGGALNATANGVTFSYVLSFTGGIASADSQANGVVLSNVVSLIGGTATASSQANGVTVSYTHSLLDGAASGQSGSTANGVTFGYNVSLIAGAASGNTATQSPEVNWPLLQLRERQKAALISDLVRQAKERGKEDIEANKSRVKRAITRKIERELKDAGLLTSEIMAQVAPMVSDALTSLPLLDMAALQRQLEQFDRIIWQQAERLANEHRQAIMNDDDDAFILLLAVA